MGAFTAPGSKTGAGAAWLVGTPRRRRPRHFTPSVALARSLWPQASLPAGAAEENEPILPCSSSLYTVGSLALSHTGGGAVSVNRGAAEVLAANASTVTVFRFTVSKGVRLSRRIAACEAGVHAWKPKGCFSHFDDIYSA
jgi:hypothetical protein